MGKLIDSRYISVVIQGPLHRGLAPERGILACIDSIVNFMPDAEIIISTWEREDISDLCDYICIRSEEPGSWVDVAGREVNVNRQIVSTRVGIELASRPYVMKFRADHLLCAGAINRIFEYVGNVPEEFRLFSSPVTITNLFVRNPLRVPMLFHVSDLVHFGRKDDLLSFWGQPIIKESDYFFEEKLPKFNPFGHFLGYTNLRYVPEQALMINWLHTKGFDVSLSSSSDIGKELLRLWESVFKYNFRLISWECSGVSFPPRFFRSGFPNKTIYSVDEFEALFPENNLSLNFRYARVFFNKYFLCFFNRAWLFSTASIVVFYLFPGLGFRLRRLWQAFQRGGK